ncbi:GT4 family glycosyltransferase PelF [Pseudonocardia sp. NPDC049154]|uniref:GT4 family glycosyltransferase PelF n=1 Tax=Pseudonocardia sp. NPDC049154 TaxID=3155501 RepID=UPI003401EFFA
MKVSLVTEGTYPIQSGGVSGWCEQLIRGLPEVSFEVVALSGSGREPAVFTVPDNVTAVQRIGLWAPPPRARRVPRAVESRFAIAYEELLEAMLGDGPHSAVGFESAVRALHALAADTPLVPLLRGQRAVDLFVDVWARHRDGAGDEPLSVGDALAVTELMEHFLRPLGMPVLETDLVHATANGPGALMGLLAKWTHGTPVLLSEHGVYLRERMLAIRRSGDSRAARAAQIRFFLRLTELCYRHADLVAPVSGFNGRWARRGGAAPERVRTMHNGVDPAALPLLTEEPAEPTVAFVGRIDPLKDIELLVTAFAQVRRAIPAARLRLFGGVPAGNEDYARRCEARVAELGLADAVTFEGPVSPVTEAFRRGHIVVLSSKSEGLPLTIIEAAMSGRATVATDVGGMSEAVGEGGLVVPAGDAPAFAAACIRLLRDHELRHELAGRGRRRALELFTLERFAENFRSVYVSLAQRRPLPAHTGAPSVELPVPAGALAPAVSVRPAARLSGRPAPVEPVPVTAAAPVGRVERGGGPVEPVEVPTGRIEAVPAATSAAAPASATASDEPIEIPTSRIAAVAAAGREPVEVPTSRITAVAAAGEEAVEVSTWRITAVAESLDPPTARMARVPEPLDPPTSRIVPVAPRTRIPAQAQRPAGKPRGPVRPPAPRPSEERVRVGEAG